MFTRQRYQHGSFRKLKRKKGSPVWEFRYRDGSLPGNPQKAITLGTKEFPTEAAARRSIALEGERRKPTSDLVGVNLQRSVWQVYRG
jgi:hypothetical protein